MLWENHFYFDTRLRSLNFGSVHIKKVLSGVKNGRMITTEIMLCERFCEQKVTSVT